MRQKVDIFWEPADNINSPAGNANHTQFQRLSWKNSSSNSQSSTRPYENPKQYWELDKDGQPTYRILDGRRTAEFITPIPKPKRRREPARQARLEFDNGSGLSDGDQQYDVSASVNEIRRQVDGWRRLPSPESWGRHPRDSAPAPALAQPRFQRIPSILLSGRGH